MLRTSVHGSVSVRGHALAHLDAALIDLLPAAVYVCEAPSGVIVRYNRRAAELWGREPVPGDTCERFCGAYRLYRTDGTLLPHAHTPMADVLRTGAPVRDQEVVIERPDGSQITVLANIDALRDEQGAILGAVNVLQDITQRKQTEESLRRSEQQFRSLLERLPAGAYTCDAEGRITYFNQQAVQLWGRKPKLHDPADLYSGAVRFLSPQGRPIPHDQCWMARALQEGTPYCGQEIVIERPDGTRRHVLAHANPLRDESGNLLGAVNILVDITDRRAAEEAVRTSEARYRALVEATSQAVWSWSPVDGACLSGQAQRWWQELSGYAPQGNGGGAPIWLDVVHQEDRSAAAAAWAAAVQSGTRYEVEYRIQGRTGGWRYIHARGVPIPGSDGFVREWIGTLDDVTEQRLAEAELRRSETRFRKLVEQFPLSIQILAPDGRTQAVNRAWEELWGMTLHEHLPDYNVRHDPQLAALGLAALIERGFAGEVVALPPGAYTPDRGRYQGQPRWVRAFLYPVKDGDRVEELVLIHEDITRQRQAEEALRESESRLEAVLASIDDHLVSYDRAWRYTFVNDKAAQVLRRRKEDLLGKCIWDLFPDAIGNPYYRHLHQALADQRPTRFEYYYEPFATWFENHVYPTPTGVTVYSADVTWRKRMEQELRDARARLQAALDAGAITTWTWDIPANRLYVDGGTARLFALACADASGELLDRYLLAVHADDRPWVARALAQAAATGTDFEADFRLMQPDGSIRWVAAHGRVEHESAGRPVRMPGVLVDITDRKYLEEELRRRAEELAAANRKKDEFLALLAHELRNPLAPLRNALQILRLTENNRAAAEEARAMMERQLGQMVRLIDDLLDVSRISRNKLELRRQQVELARVVRDAVETSRGLVEHHRHQLRVGLPATPLFLEADPTRLAQVFANLLNNAAKYTDPGGHIELTAEQDGDSILVRVRDDGIGIPRDMLGQVFEMFTQVDHSIERRQGGLGIGLTLVKRLVEMHGGTVEAKSEGLGRGSEFLVRLPVVSPGPDSESGQAAGEPGEAVPARQRRVLVVDDNVDAASSLAMMLRLMGCEVHLAHDGLEALATAEACRPEVVLMDLGMPRMNGYEAARRLREQPWGKHVTLIALTGWGQEADRQRTKEAGFDQHLVKPADPQGLHRLLSQPVTADGVPSSPRVQG